MNIGPKEKELTGSILNKVEEYKRGNDDVRIISFDSLYSLLNEDESSFIKEILEIDPKKYGFKGPYIGIVEPNDDITTVENSSGTHYLSQKVSGAYAQLRNAAQKDLGKDILIDSAYRSPGYQIVVLVEYLQKYDFDLDKTLKQVAMPGFSEHGDLNKLALDFTTEEGIVDNEFEQTPEFEWLKNNASNFGFEMSYPKDNEFGIGYEPWHWRYASN